MAAIDSASVLQLLQHQDRQHHRAPLLRPLLLLLDQRTWG